MTWIRTQKRKDGRRTPPRAEIGDDVLGKMMRRSMVAAMLVGALVVILATSCQVFRTTHYADHNAWSQLAAKVPYAFLGNNDLWISDPRLGPDLYPLADSPVIDSGQDVGLSDDYCRRLRSDGYPDVGAQEYLGDPQLLRTCENRYRVQVPTVPNVGR